MAPFAIGLGILGTAFSTIGQLKQASSQAEQAEFSAKESEMAAGRSDRKAALVREQTFDDVKTSARETAKVLGSIRTAYGASGVTMDGTPQEYLESQAAIGKANMIAINHKGILQARAYREEAQSLRRQAEQYRIGGDNAQTAGLIGAVAAGSSGLYSTIKDYAVPGRLKRTA